MKKSTKTLPVSPEAYNSFLGQLNILRVRLIKSSTIANVEYPKPPETSIEVSYEPSYKIQEGGFEAFADYEVRLVDTKSEEKQGILAATYGLTFASKEDMTDEIFMVFGQLNLPVNAWPFMREYVLTSMGRMDWPTFTLPLLKPAHIQNSKANHKALKKTD